MQPAPPTTQQQQPPAANGGGDAPPRPGSDLIPGAAAGEHLTPQEAGSLVDYFLTNNQLPGDEDTKDLEITTGGRTETWTVRPIDWAAYQDARIRGTNDKTGEFDSLVHASYVVARALVYPKLGDAVTRAQAADRENAPVDAAALLRSMFRKQTGVIFKLSAKVLELSKLDQDGGDVREVPAGKP